MDKIGAYIQGRVIGVKTREPSRDGAKPELRITIVPTGRDWPVILQAPTDVSVKEQETYVFTVLVRSIGWADKQTGQPSHALVAWVLEQPQAVKVAA